MCLFLFSPGRSSVRAMLPRPTPTVIPPRSSPRRINVHFGRINRIDHPVENGNGKDRIRYRECRDR